MSEVYQPEPALQDMLSSHLDVGAYALDELAGWCKKAWPASQLAREFKTQLKEVINHPGVITPEIYKRWTNDDGFESQEDLNGHLVEVWNACFPEEPFQQ